MNHSHLDHLRHGQKVKASTVQTKKYTMAMFVSFAVFCATLIPSASAAFGDRLKPPSNMLTNPTTSTTTSSPFINRKYQYLNTPFTTTTDSPSVITFPTFDDSSPDPESDQSPNWRGAPNGQEQNWNNENENANQSDNSQNGDTKEMPSNNNNVTNDDTPFIDGLYDDDFDDDVDDDDWYPYNYLYNYEPSDFQGEWFSNSSLPLNASSSDMVGFNFNETMYHDASYDDFVDEPEEYNLYPLEPPALNKQYENSSNTNVEPSATATNESISSSGTYSRFRYAPAPYSPFDPTHQMKKVVFINPVNPKPGHHHTPLNVHKIYSGIGSHIPGIGGGGMVKYIPGAPVYRDHGPRLKYVPHGMKHRHRIPAHYHIKRYPSGKLGPIHSHEYHHHPNKDAGYYGYIPGIPGRPWKDYPLYQHVPRTKFHCKMVKYPGFYADVDTGCQVWHYCQPDGRHDKFLCPNGTIFNQATRVCEWWYNVHCPSAIYKYNINADLYKQYKKILHIHPGQKPHVHHVAVRPKYHLTTLGGMRVHGQHIGNKYPRNWSKKVHLHHKYGHKKGNKIIINKGVRRPSYGHRINKKKHHMKHHHHAHHFKKHHGGGHGMGHGGGHHGMGGGHGYPPPSSFHHKKHHHMKHHHMQHHGHHPSAYPEPIPDMLHHPPPHEHHPRRHHPHHGGGYVIKRGPHGILKVKKRIMVPHSHSHSIPLLDHAGRAPHHGHLILHHRIK